jgi:DNA repair exonuclease SbcCD ATPase subunit
MKKSAISDESKALHKLYRDGEIDEQTLEDSMTGLALLPPQETALDVYSRPCGLDPYLDNVKDKIDEFKANPPPLNTEKGRKQYASMARKVSSFKTALDGMGKDLVDELKDIPKKVDLERKRIRELLDQWRDDVRKPLDDWQAEQDAIEAKRLADIAAKELQDQVDRDHELAVFLYADYLRQKEEAAKQAIIDAENAAKAQKEREEQIAKEAAENARIAAEKEAQAAIDRAEREKVEAENARLLQQQQAEQAAAKAKQDAINALAQAEKEKIAAIEAERQRVENERLEAERKQQELEKNRAHVGQKRKEAKEALMLICGIDEDLAKKVVLAISNEKITNIEIKY